MTTTESLIPACTLKQLAGPEPWAVFRRTGLLHLREVIDPLVVNRARHLGFRIFGHPDLISTACHRGNGQEGYTPPGVESVVGQPATATRHFWDLRVPNPERNTRCQFSYAFVAAIERVAQELVPIAAQTSFWMERRLPSIEDGLHRATAYGCHSFRATHYPVMERPCDNLRFPHHRDRSLFTVFAGGCEEGLQVEIDDAWHDVANPPGDVVIMGAAMLRFWSGGPKHPDRLPAVRHRVVHAEGERLSLALFVEPPHEIVMPNSNGRTAGDYIRQLIAMTRPRL